MIMNENHLFFLRHCQSLYNVQGKISGQADCPIVNKKIDCTTLKEILSLENVVIISSPLTRCLDTANLLLHSASVNWPIVVDKTIIERGMGRWEGVERKVIIKQFPDFFHNGKFIAKLTPVGDGEKYTDFQNRLIFFVHTIERIIKEKHIIVCSHNQTLRMITALITKKNYDFVSSYPNGVVTKII